MKTRLAFGVLMVSFACGVETEGDAVTEGVASDSSDLKQTPPKPEVVRIPITLANPEANDGLEPDGVGYPGWSSLDFHGDQSA